MPLEGHARRRCRDAGISGKSRKKAKYCVVFLSTPKIDNDAVHRGRYYGLRMSSVTEEVVVGMYERRINLTVGKKHAKMRAGFERTVNRRLIEGAPQEVQPVPPISKKKGPGASQMSSAGAPQAMRVAPPQRLPPLKAPLHTGPSPDILRSSSTVSNFIIHFEQLLGSY
ncbi:hypothetical protein M422DRAFT_247337 [Sphaerobolus stellatus SS14]|nr:hypothetical protein M422DRAFT_247337 [Sphaerobolus stellatus SS14]